MYSKIFLSKFNSQNGIHLCLADLSSKAHEVYKGNKEEEIRKIEKEINEVSAQVWGLTKEELRDIKMSLEELL